MKMFAYIGLIMSLFFIGISVVLVANPPESVPMLRDNPTIRILFAVVVLFYGLFRMYRSVRILRNNPEEDSE